MNDKNGKAVVGMGILAVILFFGFVGFVMWGLPQYTVYKQELNGKADLKEAEWSRQIAVEEAKAEKESALLKKEADIIRAEGVAASNEIIAESLTPQYITWKWVEGLHDGSSEVIYVPTEGNLPILEANRFK